MAPPYAFWGGLPGLDHSRAPGLPRITPCHRGQAPWTITRGHPGRRTGVTLDADPGPSPSGTLDADHWPRPLGTLDAGPGAPWPVGHGTPTPPPPAGAKHQRGRRWQEGPLGAPRGGGLVRGGAKQNKTYSTQDSQIVTDSNTNCAYGCLSCPDRTREAVFTRQWPYVLWSHGFVVHVAGGSHAPRVHGGGGGRAPHHPLRLTQASGQGPLPEQRRGHL